MTLRTQNRPRLCVHRSAKHIYAQIISADSRSVLAAASTLEKNMRSKKMHKNLDGAKAIGALIADRAKKQKVLTVGFDRSGFKYHGCVKVLADSARAQGLKF